MSFSWELPLTGACDIQTKQLLEQCDAKTTLMSLDGMILCNAAINYSEYLMLNILQYQYNKKLSHEMYEKA